MPNDGVMILKGKRYIFKANKDYPTIRDFYSHDGPGWDFKEGILGQYGVDRPEDLPNEPYGEWIPVN